MVCISFSQNKRVSAAATGSQGAPVFLSPEPEPCPGCPTIYCQQHGTETHGVWHICCYRRR